MSSVWTSQYPDRHHSEVSFSARLPKDRLTLAELLSGAGRPHRRLRGERGGRAGSSASTAASSSSTRSSATSGSRGDVFRQVVPAWLRQEPRPALLRLRPLPRAALPLRPRAAVRHAVRAGRPDPEGGAAQRRVLPGREPGPAAVQRAGARAPRPPLRRQPGLRRPGGRARCAARSRRRGSGTAPSSSSPPTTARSSFEHGWIGHNVHVYEPSVHVPADRPLPEGRRAPRARGSARSPTSSTWRRRSPTCSACAARAAPTSSSRDGACCPAIAGAPGKPAVLSRTVWDRPRYALRDERYKFFYDTRTGEERLVRPRARPRGARTTSPRASRCARRTTARRCTTGRCASPRRRSPAGQSRRSSAASSART